MSTHFHRQSYLISDNPTHRPRYEINHFHKHIDDQLLDYIDSSKIPFRTKSVSLRPTEFSNRRHVMLYFGEMKCTIRVRAFLVLVADWKSVSGCNAARKTRFRLAQLAHIAFHRRERTMFECLNRMM